jgi:hypothetical protein
MLPIRHKQESPTVKIPYAHYNGALTVHHFRAQFIHFTDRMAVETLLSVAKQPNRHMP